MLCHMVIDLSDLLCTRDESLRCGIHFSLAQFR